MRLSRALVGMYGWGRLLLFSVAPLLLVSGAAAGLPYFAWTYTAYDDDATLSVRVPSGWTDVEEGTWQLEGENVGTYVAAASDSSDLIDIGTGDTFAYLTFREPGVFFGASDELALTSVDALYSRSISDKLDTECVLEDVADHADSTYVGKIRAYTNCGGTGISVGTLAAESRNESHVVLIYVQLVGQPDDGIVRRLVLNTFDVAEDKL